VQSSKWLRITYLIGIHFNPYRPYSIASSAEMQCKTQNAVQNSKMQVKTPKCRSKGFPGSCCCTFTPIGHFCRVRHGATVTSFGRPFCLLGEFGNLHLIWVQQVACRVPNGCQGNPIVHLGLQQDKFSLSEPGL